MQSVLALILARIRVLVSQCDLLIGISDGRDQWSFGDQYTIVQYIHEPSLRRIFENTGRELFTQDQTSQTQSFIR